MDDLKKRNHNLVYLGLGSNIPPRNDYLSQARKKLRQLACVKQLRASSIYETKPLGPGSGNYLNQVVELMVNKGVSPHYFLEKTQEIENQLGRIRTIKWGDRTIDLDILFWNNLILKDKNLVIPHPLLQDRLFVLEPMVELNSELVHPILKLSITELFDNLSS
ncbi:MAG: 2-amino-4-hydroxy-6-hydroxymethyldihydropteridine diphosphokinase [Myxococcota bacterium]